MVQKSLMEFMKPLKKKPAMEFMKPRFILKKKPAVLQKPVSPNPQLIQSQLLRTWPIWKLKQKLEYLKKNSDPRHNAYRVHFFYGVSG